MSAFQARSLPRAVGACRTCGARVESDQLVCLACGSRVALDYRKPPSWRVAVAIVAGVVLLVLVAAVIALNRIGDDAEREVSRTPIRAGQQDGGGKSTAKRQRERRPPANKRPAR